MPDNLVNSLFIDRTGVLWIGTENKGSAVLTFMQKVQVHNSEAGGLSDNLVTALTGGQAYSMLEQPHPVLISSG